MVVVPVALGVPLEWTSGLGPVRQGRSATPEDRGDLHALRKGLALMGEREGGCCGAATMSVPMVIETMSWPCGHVVQADDLGRLPCAVCWRYGPRLLRPFQREPMSAAWYTGAGDAPPVAPGMGQREHARVVVAGVAVWVAVEPRRTP